MNAESMAMRSRLARAGLLLGPAVCLFHPIMPGLALGLGAGLGLLLGNPVPELTKRWITRFLGAAIVGLGAGANWGTVMQAGFQGAAITIVGLCSTFITGLLLARWLRTPRDLALLLISGTAICGGSAIAAVSAVLKPRQEHCAAALAAIFCLNALGFYLFPMAGMLLLMEPAEFGLWAALAIHDTSSVVGAAAAFDPAALPVAITVKLVRTLWIMPVVFALAMLAGGGWSHRRLLPPWFLFGFLGMCGLRAWRPEYGAVYDTLDHVARRLLVAAMLLVGSTLTTTVMSCIGLRPLLLALLLWLVLSVGSLAGIRSGLILWPA